MPNPPAAVRLRPGDGRLCRTDNAVVFTPTPAPGWDEIVAAISAEAAAGRGLEPVAAVLASRALDAPPLVAVSWVPRLAVLVFGDVELTSDHPAVPMLTGRGSGTWVEHSMPTTTDRVSLVVAVDVAEDDTDLRAGVVPAGGFRLEFELRGLDGEEEVSGALASGALAAPASSAAAPVPGSQGATDAPAPASAIADMADAALQEGPAVMSGRAAGTPPPAPARSTAWRPPASVTNDPDAALRAIQAAAVTGELDDQVTAESESDGFAPSTAAPTPVPRVVEQSDETAPPTSDHHVEPEAALEAEDGEAVRHPLVDAVTCPSGHPNPPGRGSCRSCEALLSPEALVRAVARPSLGWLRFDDGDTVPVDEDLVLGRRPPEDGRRRQVLTGDRVSRHHAEIVLRGWEVLLHDPGSRNGTYVVSAGSDEPVRVDGEVPIRLEHGARVYLGTRSFVFEDDATSPVGSDDQVPERP